jgi:PAB-dependent poly(A)-specific ribonuclease subunit 2
LNRRDRDRNIPSFGAILKSSVHRDGEQQTMFCNSCRARTIATVRKTVQNFSSVLNINTNVTEDGEWRYWGTQGWLPSRLGMSTHNGRLSIFQGKDLDKKRQEERVNSEYELCGMVLEIKTEKEDPHLVAIVKIPKEELPPDATSPWYLFNDFLVRNISEDEALSFPGVWKWPSVIMYKKILSERRSTSLSQSIRSIQQDPWLLFNDFSLTQFHPNGPRDPRKIQHRLLAQADLPLAKKLVAIDAEFVLLQNEEAEITSTGERELLRPKRHGLGRVSLLRGWGSDMFVPFIDDYIAAGEGKENIVDYLTAFSGLVEGDLNPRTSQRTLVPLKVSRREIVN